MSKEENNFENLFKDKFENFEADVNPGVWKNVQTGLKGAGLGILIKTILNKLGANALIAIISSGVTVLSAVVIMNWTGDSDKTSENNKKSTSKTIVETVKPTKVEEIRNFLATDNAVSKPTNIVTINQKKEAESNTNNSVIKTNKKEIESAINALSGQSVASVSASTVGGAVPLIVSLSNNGNGKINNWDFGDGKKETGATPLHYYDIPGIYTIVLTSTGADGKTALDSLKIEVTGNSSMSSSAIPTSFSPNGDKENDLFRLEFQNMKEVSAVIVDSKGKILYSQKEFIGAWDGNDLKGKPMQVGVYYYLLNAVGIDGKKYDKKGTINLTR